MKTASLCRDELIVLIAKGMAYKGVGDPHARDIRGEPRWKWYLEEATKFVDVFGYAIFDKREKFYDFTS